MKVNVSDRVAATRVYTTYKDTFLKGITGAVSKELLIRDEDVQVLHGFLTEEDARAYLNSGLFTNDVVVGLRSLLQAAPEIRFYSVY